jgi:hypothetical protein
MTRQEYYENYDDHVKLNLEQKHKLEHLVNEVVELLRNAGISHSEGVKPMTDVNTLYFRFPADGVFKGFGLDIGSYGSCGITVAMEPEPGEEASQMHIMDEEGRERTP